MASNRMSRFELFIGIWNTTGEVLATDGTPPTALSATDTFRWLPGKHFIAHDVDARFGNDPIRFMEVIGYDLTSEKYVSRTYNDKGDSQIFEMTIGGRHLSIVRDSTRFNGKFDTSGNKFSGLWELRDKKTGWRPWINLRLVRA